MHMCTCAFISSIDMWIFTPRPTGAPTLTVQFVHGHTETQTQTHSMLHAHTVLRLIIHA